jgi:hypothetical protein
MDNRKLLLDNIIEIKLDNNNISILSLKLEYTINKYSAKKNSIWNIILNDKHLSKKDKYIIKYKCLNCSSLHSIGTTQFIRKINNCSFNCYLCRNNNIKNDDNHKDINNPIFLREKSILLFNEYDDDFKDNYFSFHLTESDYNRISKNIISFHNNNLNDINNYEYWSIIKVQNQMRFSSIMYDKKNNSLFKAHQPILRCDNCNLNWRAKSLEKFKNCVKILCHDCSLVNKIFNLKSYHNCNNEKILYQSKLELKFIKWCNENKIVVYNGPKISYIFENKERIYKVNFKINDILIDIKDNHILHKNDIKSGKWNAKELAINNLILSKEYSNYFLINPYNWLINLNKLLNLYRPIY